MAKDCKPEVLRQPLDADVKTALLLADMMQDHARYISEGGYLAESSRAEVRRIYADTMGMGGREQKQRDANVRAKIIGLLRTAAAMSFDVESAARFCVVAISEYFHVKNLSEELASAAIIELRGNNKTAQGRTVRALLQQLNLPGGLLSNTKNTKRARKEK